MKKKEKEQLKSLSIEELNKELMTVTGDLRKIMVGQVGKENRNTRQARQFRRKRAVILTLLRQKAYLPAGRELHHG